MSAVEFTLQAYARPSFGLPQARLINMYVEATPGGPGKGARLQRPGMTPSYSVGSGPITKVFHKAGSFNGDLFVGSGSEVYRASSLLGTVTGQPIRMDASASQHVTVDSSGLAWCYDGSTFTQITDPDLPLVDDVVYLASRFYYLQKDSDVWWFSDIDDATSIDGLAFATAESAPDANIGAAVLNDEVWFFGQETVEPWYQTGNADAPLQRGQGRKFEKGCPAQRSIVKLDNTLIFVGVSEEGLLVYRAAGVPQRISTHGVEEALAACADPADISAFAVGFDGHPQYVLNIPGVASWAYDVSTSQWAEWQSYGRTNFRASCAAMVDGVAYLGDDTTGQIWTLDKTAYLDGAEPITRLASAFMPKRSGTEPMTSLALMCVTGVGLATGQGSEPQVEMRYWDNEDESWSDWESDDLGPIGNRSARPRWQRLGVVEAPGRLIEIRITDPVLVVIESLTVNEPR